MTDKEFLEAINQSLAENGFDPFKNVPDDISPAQALGFQQQTEAERQAWVAAADAEYQTEYARLKAQGLTEQEITRAMCE